MYVCLHVRVRATSYIFKLFLSWQSIHSFFYLRERSGSVVECLTRDQRAPHIPMTLKSFSCQGHRIWNFMLKLYVYIIIARQYKQTRDTKLSQQLNYAFLQYRPVYELVLYVKFNHFQTCWYVSEFYKYKAIMMIMCLI